MEIFTFRPQNEPVGQFTQSVLRVQFGDSYAQTAHNGLNSCLQSWPLVFVEKREKIAQIKAFLDRHKGAKAFLWTPPFDDQGVYMARSGYTITPMGPRYAKLEVTLHEEVRP